MTVVGESRFASVREDTQSRIGPQLLFKVTWRELFLFKTNFCTSGHLELQKDFVFKIFLALP